MMIIMSIESAINRLDKINYNFKNGNMLFILNELYYYFKRTINSEFIISSRIDSLCFPLLLIFSLICEKILNINNNMVIAYARKQEYRIAKHIEKKYNVRLIYRFFPLDIFWKDYFQRSDFIKKNSVIIDVGANIGDFAIIASKYFEAYKIIAIEPDREAYGYLVKNIRMNDLEGNIIPINIAASKTNGNILLRKNGRYLTNTGKSMPESYTSKKLDSIIEQYGFVGVDLLKIDTEGSELSILQGAKKLLHVMRPKIIMETHSQTARKQVMNLIFSFKYNVVYEKCNFPDPLISVMYFIPR